MTNTPGSFDYFVIVAGMRTGSNLLEERLNEHPRIKGLGELFNPHFVGRPKQDAALGISRAARNADPMSMLAAVADHPDHLAGFRLFDGHDGRVLDHVLSDPRCGRILLTRDPLDSYVSLKIARQTQQWWLGNVASKKSAKVAFDADEFNAFLQESHAFQALIRQGLQRSGQTAFALGYSDLADTDILDGLVRFLGLESVEWRTRPKARKQNPGPIEDKLTNPEALGPALARLDPFDLGRLPDLEPGRGAGAPGVLVAETARLAFMPVGGIALAPVEDWLTRVNGGAPPRRGMTQKELKAWFRQTPGHRCFAVIEHPVPRAFAVVRRKLLGEGGVRDETLAAILEQDFDLPPALSPQADRDARRAALLSFLAYVKATLGGQTGHRIGPEWASQTAILEGIAPMRMPDFIIRSDELARGLSILQDTDPPTQQAPAGLAEIYDAKIEAAARAAYRRDYAFLGFGDWTP